MSAPDWKKVADQLADAISYTYRVRPIGNATYSEVCARCDADVPKHNPDTCEVAAALRAYEEASR